MTIVVKATGMTGPLATPLPSNNHKRLFGDSPSCAGENLGPADACYVDAAGFVMRAIEGQANTAIAINDVQTMSALGDTDPTHYNVGSSFVMGYKGQYTPPQPAASGSAVSAGTLQTALRALPTIGAGNITVGGAFPNFTFTGAGSLAGVELDLLEVDPSLIDSASNVPVSLQITHTTVGQPVGTASVVEPSSRVRGFTMMAVKSGQPVNLYDSVELAYSDGNLTPGAEYYLSAVTPGALDTVAANTGQPSLGYAVNTQVLFVYAARGV